jgi:ketosteroid isomerase-like protein
MYEAFGRGDIATVTGHMDPKVEWNEAENFIYADGNPYRGPDAVAAGVFARIGTEWEGFAATPHRFHDAGDSVIIEGRYTGVNRASGQAVNAQFAHILTFEGGKLVRFQQYTDTAQVRDAVREAAMTALGR